MESHGHQYRELQEVTSLRAFPKKLAGNLALTYRLLHIALIRR